MSRSCVVKLGYCSYGHGVLRYPDPRFMALQDFCQSRPNLLADPIVQLVKKVRRSLPFRERR